MGTWLVVGLGNPGSEYDHTPHNIGFEVVSRLASRKATVFRRSPTGPAMEAVLPGDPRTVLLKPQAYMNRSGVPVAAALNYYRLGPPELLVVCDDANLPAGYIRFRKSGGAGGQKGLESIIRALDTVDFARIRIGVGGGHPGADLAGHVLRKWTGERRRQMDQVADLAADAVTCFLREGIDSAMNQFNTSKPQSSTEQSHPSRDRESRDEPDQREKKKGDEIL